MSYLAVVLANLICNLVMHRYFLMISYFYLAVVGAAKSIRCTKSVSLTFHISHCCGSHTCKAHCDNFWSEFFEHSAKPRAAMQIFDVAIRWASVRVINFCSMQTLQALNELRFNFQWKHGISWAFSACKNVVWHHLFSYSTESCNKFCLIGGGSREPNSNLYSTRGGQQVRIF